MTNHKKQFIRITKLACIIALIVIPCEHFSQSPQITTLDILPSEPTISDEVELAIRLFFTGVSPYQGSTVQIVDDTIKVASCNLFSQSPSPQNYIDTLSIGILEEGDYTLHFEAWLTNDPDSCFSYLGNDSIFNFSITGPATLNEFELHEKVSVWPNPNSSRILHINTKLPLHSIYLSDLSGRLFKQVHSFENGEIIMDLSELASGSYFIRIVTTSEQALVRKVILE